jgi:perosamine synthetase
MGCAQIERADELIEKKRENFQWYKEIFHDEAHFKMNPELPGTYNSYWMPTLLIDHRFKVDRDGLIAYLKNNGIDSRPFFYPLSSLPMFEDRRSNTVAYDLYHRGINLPSHQDLSAGDAGYVAEKILNYLGA